MSLIETCISLMLSVMILILSMKWYQNLKTSTVKQDSINHATEMTSVFLQFVGRDVRWAGYRGLRMTDPAFPVRSTLVNGSYAFQYSPADGVVYGFNSILGECEKQLPVSACQRIKKGSDVLILYNVPKEKMILAKDMDSLEQELWIQGEPAIQEGSVAIISDIFQADRFVVSLVQNNRIYHHQRYPLNQTSSLSKRYLIGAEIHELETVAYYLGAPHRLDKSTQVFSLYRDNLLQQADELVEGITNMQVVFGLGSQKSGIEYRKAKEIFSEQWRQVISVCFQVQTKEGKQYYEFAIRNRSRFFDNIDRFSWNVNALYQSHERRMA